MGGCVVQFEFTEEQDALRSLVREVCEQHGDPRRCYDEDSRDVHIDAQLWGALSAAGIPGLGVSSEFDGGDAGVVELVLAAEELGRTVSAVPFSEHAAAADVVQRFGDDEQRKRHLMPIARGEIVAGIAGPQPATDAGVTAQRDGARWRLQGQLRLIPNAAAAQSMVLVAQVDGVPRWFLVGDGLQIDPLPTVDRTRPAGSVTFDGVPAELLGGGGEPARVPELLMTLAAAEAAGAASQALDVTAQYATERKQFGLPIGTFQAVKHRLADMLVEVENSRSAVFGAAWALADGGDATLAVAMAQAVATANVVDVAGAAIQLHGGIGVTWESDLHLYLRRAKALQATYGSPAFHRAAIAAELLDRS